MAQVQAQQKPAQATGQTTQPMGEQPVEGKKMAWWIWVVIAVGVIGIGAGAYYWLI